MRSIQEHPMAVNSFRKALLDRRPIIGSWIQMAGPTSAEIMAQAGFDWLGIDLEHADTEKDARRAVTAAKYPPEGVRGFAFCRANAYGEAFDAYVKTARAVHDMVK